MSKRPKIVENSDGATQIEVTPEMIEAGLEAYMSRCPGSGDYSRYSKDMIREIFDAMYGARHYKKPPPTPEELQEQEMAEAYWRDRGWIVRPVV